MTRKKPPKVDSRATRLDKAIKKWQEDSITHKLNNLAIEYNVPKSSLYARARDRKSHIKRAESQKRFTQKEKDALIA